MILSAKMKCGCLREIIHGDRANKNDIRNFRARARRNEDSIEEHENDYSFELHRCKPHQAAHEAYMQALKEQKERTN